MGVAVSRGHISDLFGGSFDASQQRYFLIRRSEGSLFLIKKEGSSRCPNKLRDTIATPDVPAAAEGIQ